MDLDKITELRAKRFKFLEALYEITGGDNGTIVFGFELGEELGFDEIETSRIAEYLRNQGLIEFMTGNLGVSITHYGVIEVEDAVSKPSEPTKYFPAVNIIKIESMVNSQIQQNVENSTQNWSINQGNLEELQSFINELKAALPSMNLKPDDLKEVNADTTTIEAQLSSSRPKPGIINESLKSIKNILEGAAGSILASSFLEKIPLFLEKF